MTQLPGQEFQVSRCDAVRVTQTDFVAVAAAVLV